ncbi:MAG: glycosyltransferase family 2 protein [Oscillospiraceae bacterium]
MDKLLSVIIPSYNSKPYLEKCLDSLLCESMDKLDVIVVNDGSTDGCEEIAEKYVEKYPQTFSLISKENGGHGSAINAGSMNAVGKYMKVLDADDWFATENIPAFLEKLENATADVVLTCHHTINVSTGEVKCWRNYPPKYDEEYTLEYVMANWKSFDRSLTFHGITYRTDFYKQYGIKLSEHVFYEDHEYATYPCCYAKTILPLDLFIYEYRIGDVSQSVSAENQLKRIKHTFIVISRLINEKANVSDSYGIAYVDKKTHLLLLSYLVTTMLCDPDRTRGCARGIRMMNYVKEKNPVVYDMSINHFKILKLMNLMNVSYENYNKILNSELYNKLRNNKNFD